MNTVCQHLCHCKCMNWHTHTHTLTVIVHQIKRMWTITTNEAVVIVIKRTSSLPQWHTRTRLWCITECHNEWLIWRGLFDFVNKLVNVTEWNSCILEYLHVFKAHCKTKLEMTWVMMLNHVSSQKSLYVYIQGSLDIITQTNVNAHQALNMNEIHRSADTGSLTVGGLWAWLSGKWVFFWRRPSVVWLELLADNFDEWLKILFDIVIILRSKVTMESMHYNCCHTV